MNVRHISISVWFFTMQKYHEYGQCGTVQTYYQISIVVTMQPINKSVYQFKPIFHCNLKPLVLGPCVGLDPQHNDFALPIPTCWSLKTLKCALPPTRNPNTRQWNISRVGSNTKFFRWPCTFHFCVCPFH